MDSNVSRRGFLMGAAATAAAAATTTAQAVNCAAAPAKWDKMADVVVLGAGGAGLNAAIQAHDAGAKVIVVDKSASSFHSATRMCGGLYTAYGSRMQREAEAKDPKLPKDSAEQFADDVLAYGGYMGNKELVLAFAKNSGKAFDWMEDHGLAKHHLEKYAGHNRLRALRQDNYTGNDYIVVLDKELKARKIETYHSTKLTRIFFDQKANRVTGVEVMGMGKTFTIQAKKGIVMATGGITGTPESLDKWVPQVAGFGVAIGCDANNGEAMMIAVRDCGVPLSHMQYIASYPCGVVCGGRNGCYCRMWYFVGFGGIFINKNGKRFITERSGICHITPHLAEQPGHCYYAFMDEQCWKETRAKYPKDGALFGLPAWTNARIEAELKLNKRLFKQDTIEDLAKVSGINAAGLKQQLADWNKCVAAKNDPLGRTDFVRPISEKGPYYAVQLFPWNNLSCGGVRCNKDLQVLGWDDKPIGGFYAAGETVAAIHGNSYCGGNACGFANTSGWMAGQLVMGKKL